MARINIEECWWSDPRRGLLIDLLGSVDAADIAAIKAWRTAQGFWKKGKLVPWSIFHCIRGAAELVSVGLARFHELEEPASEIVQADPKQDPSKLQALYVYVAGSSDFLSWVSEQRVKGSNGGKKSAQRPRDAKGRLTKRAENSPSKLQAESKQTQASCSSSVSCSISNSKNTMNPSDSCAEAQAGENPGGDERNPGDPPNACQVFIGTYAKAYEAKYHFRPEVVLAEAGAAKNIVKALGLQKALLFIPTYLSMTDSWFLTKRHSLCAMVSNLNAIKQFHQTGKVTSINANGGRKKTAFERDEDIDAEMQKLLSGEAAHG